MARAAERLVRAGTAGSLDWNGTSLASHFQPILSVRDPACHGYEALLRASDGARRRVATAELFERAGQSRAVLDWACRALHLRNYARFDPDERTLFLNVHPQAAAHDASCAVELGDLVRYYGLLPKRVCVEISPDECADEQALLEAVAIYREMGISIAVDGFGRARSNFDRVIAARPDVVKIDRSLFADRMLGWGRARRMLSGVVELLHEVRARVVVSGIETPAEARVAIDAGADYVQGYFFCKPEAAPADEAAAVARLSAVLVAGGRRNLAVAS
jgi:EAL domain-containing protein (putative c-di-GMP-specific phosphodiesterase class I)